MTDDDLIQWIGDRDEFSLYSEGDVAVLYVGDDKTTFRLGDSGVTKIKFQKSRNDHIKSWVGVTNRHWVMVLQLKDGKLRFSGVLTPITQLVQRMTPDRSHPSMRLKYLTMILSTLR